MKSILELDLIRYGDGTMPTFQKWFRRVQMARNPLTKNLYKLLFTYSKKRYMVEFGCETSIGKGLCIGHPYCITINPGTVIGQNVNIHKGVTIGQENRGRRKGVPVIGDEVWIGVNATIVGGIHIGNDVLIAANSYVNCDIPDHSVVFGNPCIIKHRDHATEDYINRKV